MPRDASCGGRWIRELLRIEKRTSLYLVRYKLMEPIFGKESEKSKGQAARDEKRAPHPDTPSRDAAPSAGGVEFGSALGLILGFEWPGWRPRWPRLGDLESGYAV